MLGEEEKKKKSSASLDQSNNSNILSNNITYNKHEIRLRTLPRAGKQARWKKKKKLTCKGHTHMLIEGTDLPNRSLLLQLSYRLFLYTQNNDVFTPDSDLYENIKKGDLQDQ